MVPPKKKMPPYFRSSEVRGVGDEVRVRNQPDVPERTRDDTSSKTSMTEMLVGQGPRKSAHMHTHH